MKIVQQTPNQLLLRELQVLSHVFSLIFGVVFTAVGLFFIALPNVTTLTCNRTEPTQGSCKLLASGLLASEVREIPISILQGAKVDESRSSKSTTYGVVLLTITGEVPFTFYSNFDKGKKQAIASRINDFVKIPGETSLAVKQDDRWISYLFGGTFAAIGIFFAFGFVVAPVVKTWLFDKTLGSFTLKQQGLFGTKIIEYQIREIADVQVEEWTNSKGTIYYKVSIVLVSGDRLPLTLYSSSGKKSKQKTASCIRKFLNLDEPILS